MGISELGRGDFSQTPKSKFTKISEAPQMGDVFPVDVKISSQVKSEKPIEQRKDSSRGEQRSFSFEKLSEERRPEAAAGNGGDKPPTDLPPTEKGVGFPIEEPRENFENSLEHKKSVDLPSSELKESIPELPTIKEIGDQSIHMEGRAIITNA